MAWGTNLLNGLLGALFGEDIYEDNKGADSFFKDRQSGSNDSRDQNNNSQNNKAKNFRYDPLDDEEVPEGQYTKDSRKYGSNNSSQKSYSSRNTSYQSNNRNSYKTDSNSSSGGFNYYDAADDSPGSKYQSFSQNSSSNSNKTQSYARDRSASASQGFRRQRAAKSTDGWFSYPTLSTKGSKVVRNDKASFTFGIPHFSTFDHGVRGIAFPYSLRVNNPKNRKIVVSGKFCTKSGAWIKSLVPDMADRYGDLVINESVICIDNKFNNDSYLFVPYGVLSLKETQKIYLNIDVFVDFTSGPQHLLRYVYGFDYFIYENDPREQVSPKTTSRSTTSRTSSYSSSTSSNENVFDKQNGFEEVIGLVAHIVKADGVCAPEEIRVVIDHFKDFKGIDKDLLKERLKYKLSNPSNIENDCKVLKETFYTQTRLTFLALFFKIAVSDKAIPTDELELIEKIANLMGISKASYEQIRAEFLPASDKVWHLFGLTSNATKEQLKSAYRKKCKECHPDRFANASQAQYKKAEEMFKELQDYYNFLLRKF